MTPIALAAAPLTQTQHRAAASRPRAPKWMNVALLACALVAVVVAFNASLADLIRNWMSHEEYSHAFLIPLAAAFLLVRGLANRGVTPRAHSWFGPVIVAACLMLATASEVSAVYTVTQYALLGVLAGFAVALIGGNASRAAVAPLVLLALAIPLPFYFQVELTSELQLISSRLGVAVLHSIDVPAYLDGNIIDLGTYKLQVLEACSGLSYLFPLGSFAFICACLFRGPFWQRTVIVLSAIPITVLMNSVRIAIAGFLVDAYGPASAEGFIHGFQGWFVFVVSLALLFGVMSILARVGTDKPGSLVAAIDTSMPRWKNSADDRVPWAATGPLAAATLLAVFAAFAVAAYAQRIEQIPERTPLALFPTTIGERYGHRGTLDRATIETLRLDDYVIAEYGTPATPSAVEVYIAYYASQRDGASPHSPKVCLPAGGWEITHFERTNVPLGASPGSVSLNRVVMQKGQRRLLAYYWFQQRGQSFANEYRMKWNLFTDGLWLNRTDGALVRLVTPVDAGLEASELRLRAFLDELWPVLPAFVPN